MPRKPDVLCAGTRGQLIWRSKTSLPEGQAMCRSCRAERLAHLGGKHTPRTRWLTNAAPLTCVRCGVEFPFALGSKGPRKTCTEECRQALLRERGRAWVRVQRLVGEHPCHDCGRRVEGNLRCEDCAARASKAAMARANANRPERKAAAAARVGLTCATCSAPVKDSRRRKYCSSACEPSYKPAPKVRHCTVCGQAFAGRGGKTCSVECSAEASRRYERARRKPPWDRSVRICGHTPCAAAFVPTRAKQAYCDAKCAAAARRRRERDEGKRHRDLHRERAERFGREWEPIRPKKVFERDGWRCRVPECRERSRKVRRDVHYSHPLAPTLDHIVPMSVEGGDHVYANVQTAHRRCNERKGNQFVAVQLALVG